MAKQAGKVQKSRRKPVQSRSRETSRAIRDAFVRLLDEKPYPQVTIREIVLVAGVGLGTFYEYFDSKDALARACVHLRTKELLRAVKLARARLATYPLVEGVAAAIDAQMKIYAGAPREWSQHFLLERQKSDLKYYREAYELFVAEWRGILQGAADWPANAPAERAARMAFTLVYGMLSHAMLRADRAPDLGALRDDMQRAALACISTCRAGAQA